MSKIFFLKNIDMKCYLAMSPVFTQLHVIYCCLSDKVFLKSSQHKWVIVYLYFLVFSPTLIKKEMFFWDWLCLTVIIWEDICTFWMKINQLFIYIKMICILRTVCIIFSVLKKWTFNLITCLSLQRQQTILWRKLLSKSICID